MLFKENINHYFLLIFSMKTTKFKHNNHRSLHAGMPFPPGCLLSLYESFKNQIQTAEANMHECLHIFKVWGK